MNSIFILSFGLLVSLNCWVKSEEFCRAFRENNDRISYTYDFDSHNGLDVFIDVIINGKHWRLQTNNEVKGLKFQNQKYESQPTLPFYSSGDYSLALKTCRNRRNGCSVLLINTNTWMASFGSPSTTGLPGTIIPENLKQIKIKKVNGIKGKPFAAFEPDYDSLRGRKVFIEYNRTTGQLDANLYVLFDTDGNEINAVLMKWADDLMRFLKKNIGKLNLLSLISINKSGHNWGYILLYEEDLQLKWCWTDAEEDLSNECKPGSLLINCLPTTTSTTTSEPKTSGNQWITFVIIGFCIVIGIIVMTAIVIYFIPNKSKSEASTSHTSKASTSHTSKASTSHTAQASTSYTAQASTVSGSSSGASLDKNTDRNVKVTED